MNIRKLAGCLLLILAFIFGAKGQAEKLDAPTKLPEDLPRLNAFQITIADGRLSGKGADLIEAAMKNVQFVALGEEHNKRAVHKFGGALFRLLHEQYNFNYLALEEDALWGNMLSQAARKNGGQAVLNIALHYPNAFHLETEEEMQMIGDIGKNSAAINSVWGLNQAFGAAHIYERLIKIAPNKAAEAVAQKLYAQSLEYEKERFQKNIQYIAQVAKPEDFDNLRQAFQSKRHSEADFLIEQLALSNRIFAPYLIKPRPPSADFYEAGKLRESNMKTLFAKEYKIAQSRGEKLPKVMVMLGQLHLYRGLSERTEQYSFGNFLSELAAFNDQKSLHIYVAVDGSFIREGAFGGLAETALKTAVETDSGAVIDLRPLFDYARSSREINPQLRRMIMSYDFFLLLRDSTAGSTKCLQTPNFRWYPN